MNPLEVSGNYNNCDLLTNLGCWKYPVNHSASLIDTKVTLNRLCYKHFQTNYLHRSWKYQKNLHKLKLTQVSE